MYTDGAGYNYMQPIGLDAERIRAFDERYKQRIARENAETERLEEAKKATTEAARQTKELAKQEKREKKKRRKCGARCQPDDRSLKGEKPVEKSDFQFRNNVEESGALSKEINGHTTSEPFEKSCGDVGGWCLKNEMVFSRATDDDETREDRKEKKSLFRFMKKRTRSEVVVR